ncbi:DNA sulfur modification protein DndD [Sphaerotilus sp.]|uniref:DNA sulfur modification protein DndD n=1 Tax=Sphaerotilus sp. TaxID=2093942 RepID=UPI0025D7C68D|nr:DNA sulfur modification protein DndD [Sphaerotilus sp.]
MIFNKLTINNIFSYHGECVFDFTPLSDRPEANILLIWGRNGYGKTSLLNSLKLALSGVSDDLRASVHNGRSLKRDHYLLGMADEWMGVINRQARAAGEKKFGVKLEWMEAAGSVTLERDWTLEGRAVSERLAVTPSFGDKPSTDTNGPLDGESRDFVQKRLPSALLPFFIYDAERVQQLAEANRDGQMHQIEEILDLVDIDVIDQYLGNNLTFLRREAKDRNQYQVDAQRLELQAVEAKCAGLQVEKDDLDGEISGLKARIDRIEVALQARRQFALQTEEAELTIGRTFTTKQLEDRMHRFFMTVTREAPLALNSALMQQASDELEKIVSHPNRRLKDELGRIFEVLPQRLLRDPPKIDLKPEQISALERKLDKIIRAYQPDAEDMTAGLFHLPPARAEAVSTTVDNYARDQRAARNWKEDLLEVRRLKAALKDIERKLNDVSNLAPAEKEQFELKAAEKSDLETRKAELNQKIGAINQQLTDLNRDLLAKKESLRQAEKELNEALAAQGRLGVGQRLQKALKIYRDLLKSRRRGEIEDAVNERFQVLMSSHQLIRKIRVNEDFSLHYEDANGGVIGMGNISAGMKQLVAQALLWGLKDVTQKDAPVVIDTPLARIDREHQNNLITRYFPQAGRQVIILPTDSELDREKYELIRPYVYREYRLVNRSGEATQVELGGYY